MTTSIIYRERVTIHTGKLHMCIFALNVYVSLIEEYHSLPWRNYVLDSAIISYFECKIKHMKSICMFPVRLPRLQLAVRRSLYHQCDIIHIIISSLA
jgi:hypothetical protein